MSARTRGVLAVIVASVALALIVTSIPAVSGRPMASAIGSAMVGGALAVGALMLSLPTLRELCGAHRDVRRGIRQIETVLALEAALAERRLKVPESNSGGCPICGAPAGPHCVCPKH